MSRKQYLQASSGGFQAIFSSDDRSTGSTHDFTINMNPALDFSGQDRWEMAVLGVNTWYSSYNISDDYVNRVIKYYNGVETKTITLESGNYSADDLILEIGQWIEANEDDPDAITIFANHNPQKFEFQFLGGYKLDFTEGLLYTIFGVEAIVYDADFVAPSVAKVSNGVNSFIINTDIVSGSILGANSGYAITTFVPVGEPGSAIYHTPNFACYSLVQPVKFIRKIRIWLTDQTGSRPINLNGEPLSLQLHFRPVVSK